MHKECCSTRFKIYGIIIVVLCIILVVVNYQPLSNKFSKSTSQNLAVEKDYVNAFTKIYKTNAWLKGSGVGSEPQNAAQYMALLQQYIDDPRFATIVDIGCGDWQFMRYINIPSNKSYLGFDVVENLIQLNSTEYAKDNVVFAHTTGFEDLVAKNVSGDLLIVKDVLQHLPSEEIEYFINNVLPRFKYALITNYYDPQSKAITYTKMGPWHSVGILEAPFSLKHAKIILEYDGPDHKQVVFYENPNLH